MQISGGGAANVGSAQITDGAIIDADINANAAIADTKLAQIVTAGKVSGAAITSLASVPAAAGVLPGHFPATQVFSGVSPTTFTDLDLSAVIGAAKRVVLLEVTSTAAAQFFFEPKGAGTGFDLVTGTTDGGVSKNNTVNGSRTLSLVYTDASGVVQWKTNTADTCTITVAAYW